MQLTVLRERMFQAIGDQSRVYLIMLLISILYLVGTSIYYLKTGSNDGVSLFSFIPWMQKRKHRYSTKQQITRMIIAIVLLLVLLTGYSVPAIFDMVTANYTKCTGEYYRPASSSLGRMYKFEYISFSTNDTKLTLILPDVFSDEEFPYGSYSGTAVYGKKSKILLSFSRDDSSD